MKKKKMFISSSQIPLAGQEAGYTLCLSSPFRPTCPLSSAVAEDDCFPVFSTFTQDSMQVKIIATQSDSEAYYDLLLHLIKMVSVKSL